jgi:signal transduction histidine kinase/ActR/RegA family two-component response regulator
MPLTWPKVQVGEPTLESDADFTLDASLLRERRAANARRLNTLQLPAVRACGFAILCVISVMQDVRLGTPLWQPQLMWVLTLNVGYCAVSWLVLQRWYGRTGGIDLGLVFMHLDILVWLVNLRHLEQTHLFFGYLLMIRVADQVGYGFRRALYFSHVIVASYLVYSWWVAHQPGDPLWSERFTMAAAMYLLGIYLAFTGLVSARLRSRARQAIHTARALVDDLERQKSVLEVQARELEEASRKAEQANVAKAQFLATISHEIRTPMNGVLGTTELLLAMPLEGRQRRLAETAHHSATALLALIDDVLDLSRIEASKLTLHSTSFDLRALVSEAAELMATTARGKPLALSCTLSAALPERVEGDPMRLRQVLVNLLHNAVKFTERGGIALEVIVLDDSDDSVRLLFEVRDTGIGLAEDQFDSVFDAFTQVDASSTRRHGGTGLGLAIVKEIAELMGGQVGVDSRLEEGSTFWFEVSLKKGSVPSGSLALGTAPLPILAVRILLAEDDAVNQMVVEEMLTGMGCVVDVVDDGDAACAAAAQTAYDLIFMDCHMPVLDGFEATRRIRAALDGRGARTPIVALTADALAGDRERCLACGMNDYMTKPVSSAQLAAAVRRWAGDGSSREATRAPLA